MRSSVLFAIATCVLALAETMASAQTPAIYRVSVATGGVQANGDSLEPAVSPDGRYVTFHSRASNLVPNDTNGVDDVFVHDLQTGTTTRVSVATGGAQADGASHDARISLLGRYVVFVSSATTLVAGDTNGADDVFVHDLQTATTTRVSVATDGTQANGHSATPTISEDGRIIDFSSSADNLVPGDSNGVDDVFMHDCLTGDTLRVSQSAGGVEGDRRSYAPAGGFVFVSDATNLVPGDTNGAADVFVRWGPGIFDRMSIAADGSQANGPSHSAANGPWVAFTSSATNLVAGDTNGVEDVFVRGYGTTRRVSVNTNGTEGAGPSSAPAGSSDGRYVAFWSSAANLVTGDTNGVADVFVRDLFGQTTVRVSVGSDGSAANGASFSGAASVSRDGGVIAFRSSATNLVAGDTNGVDDVFVATNASLALGPVVVVTSPANGQTVTTSPLIVTGTATDSGRGDHGVVSVYVAANRASNDTAVGSGTANWTASVNLVLGVNTIQVVATDGNRDQTSVTLTVTYVTTGHISGRVATIGGVALGNVQVVVFRQTGPGSWMHVTNVDTDLSGAYLVADVPSGTYYLWTRVQGYVNEMYNDVSCEDAMTPMYSCTPTATAVTVTAGATTSNIDFELARDPTPPVLVVASPVNGQVITKSPVVITGTATDSGRGEDGISSVTVAGVRAGSDTAGWGFTATWTASVALTPGTNTIPVVATDGAGNTTSTVLTLVYQGSETRAPRTTRVSLAYAGGDTNDSSVDGAISGDGRYVAFFSEATNLVPGDTNRVSDVFLHDRQTRLTTRVSVASGGEQADGTSYYPGISADGRSVAFSSLATNLVAGDTNGVQDAFVYDRQTGLTTRVSIATDGSQANGDSFVNGLSADGRYVGFLSYARNLVPGDTNNVADAFVHDRQTGTTTRVSVATSGAQGNGNSGGVSISADGRYAGFSSSATNLVDDDRNAAEDVFVHDAHTGTTTRVSVAANGTEGNGHSSYGDVSADGRYVAFSSLAGNLVAGDANGASDIFIHDLALHTTTRLGLAAGGGEANGDSIMPTLSTDGRHVAFPSLATNLAPGDTNGVSDVFVHDRQTGTTTRVSVAMGGGDANGHSGNPAISASGRFVVFESHATNLVSGDANGKLDVFVRDQRGPATHCDFDGDVKTDPTVFRSTSGVWYQLRSTTGSGHGVAWGTNGDTPTPGDYDGDGATDIAVFRPAEGTWYIVPTSTRTPIGVPWGQRDDVAVPADYDGDGKTDVAVFRPSSGTWYLVGSSTNTPVGVQWGQAGDIPMPADYDGDGKADVAVFRQSAGAWLIVHSATNTAVGLPWGQPGDVPLVADFDGDGRADPTLYRAGTGAWYQWRSTSNSAFGFGWGQVGDTPVVGDYDGDSKADPAVFRESTGTWYQLRSASGARGVSWGAAGDRPL